MTMTCQLCWPRCIKLTFSFLPIEYNNKSGNRQEEIRISLLKVEHIWRRKWLMTMTQYTNFSIHQSLDNSH